MQKYTQEEPRLEEMSVVLTTSLSECKTEKNLLCFKRKQMRLSQAAWLANTKQSLLLPSLSRSSCSVLCFPFLCAPNCNVLYKNPNAQRHVL